MEHIVDGVFTVFYHENQDEAKLVKSILNGAKLDKELNNKVLNLTIEKQLHFINYLVTTSEFGDDADGVHRLSSPIADIFDIGEFLDQDCFKEQKELLVALFATAEGSGGVDNEEDRIVYEKTISDFQKKYNIQILAGKEDYENMNEDEDIVFFIEHTVDDNTTFLREGKVEGLTDSLFMELWEDNEELFQEIEENNDVCLDFYGEGNREGFSISDCTNEVTKKLVKKIFKEHISLLKKLVKKHNKK